MPRKSKSQSTGLAPADPWIQWLTLVDPAHRSAVADLLERHSVEDHRGLIQFSQAVMVELIRGTIHPDVATEVRNWAELVLTAISAEMSVKGTPENAHNNILIALQSVAQQSRVTPTYITMDPPEDPGLRPEELPSLLEASKG